MSLYCSNEQYLSLELSKIPDTLYDIPEDYCYDYPVYGVTFHR
jgi:hypothetical protein